MRKAHRGHYQKKFNPYPFTENEEITVSIDSLSAMGHGVARVDHVPTAGEAVKNWVIFTPFALPGEMVKIKITHNNKKNSIGSIIEVLQPSADRVEPKCEHFFLCGGCQLQHLDYEKQLFHLTDQLAHQLQKTVSIDHPVNLAIASPNIWNYRSKLTPQFQKNKKGKITALGFLHHSNKDQIIDINQCAIAASQINDILPSFKNQHAPEDILLRLNGEKVETHPNNAVVETVGDLKFHFLAGDFFQNNSSILKKLTEYVCEQSLGSGLFALTSAAHFEQVTGVEFSATSADWARFNADHNGIKNVDFHAASAEHIFSNISYNPEQTSVIIDPPRAGCSQDFLKQLFNFKPSRVVYVSCDPATQMRDLVAFREANYEVKAIQPFDLFPHTRHLECVITLVKSEN